MEFLKDILSEETFNMLKAKVGDELFKQIADKTADFKLDVAKEKFIPKHRFDEVRQSADDFKKQLEDRAKQLDELNKQASGNAELQLKIKELQEQNKQSQVEFNDKLTKTKQDYAYKNKLNELAKDYKPKNIEDLAHFLKSEQIKFAENGETYEVQGIKEQFDELKTSKAYLFEDATPNGTGVPAGIVANGAIATDKKTGKII
jgi:dsDNA-specific endonuclease/ATPase MutS2